MSKKMISDRQYCHPDGFRRLAEKFPELKIVIAHSGGTEWFRESAVLYREQ
jgi:predicted TIM-barrel fold metal-dependent hydrolase